MVLLIGFMTVIPAVADGQVDIGLNYPYRFGIKSDNGDFDDVAKYVFLLPDIKLTYFFNEQGIRFGAGARMWTLLLETMAYPVLTLETEINRFVLSGHVGGGAFLYFGIIQGFNTESIFLPEVTVAYKFGERFSVGTGAMFFFAPEVADFDTFAYIGTIFARFTF